MRITSACEVAAPGPADPIGSWPREHRELAAALLFSLLSIAAGAFIIARPQLGELAITISLGALFMVQGAFEIALAFAVRPARPWVWMLLSALGVLIILAGVGAQIAQLVVSIRTRAALRDVTGDPWDGRSLEWATSSPPPTCRQLSSSASFRSTRRRT